MISVLIVDDDVYALESIAQNVNWEGLGVEECYTAQSAAQAKDLIIRYGIPIVITDIEMPEETGLELVEWINHNTKNTVCVFLTSYGDFAYTSQALRLHGSDYLLKPASYYEVENAVRKAIQQQRKMCQQELSVQQAAYWADSLPALRLRFWDEVIRGLMTEDGAYIARQAEKRHIPYTGEESLLILFELPDTTVIRWEQALVDVAMKNILGEVFQNENTPPVVIHMAKNFYFAMVDKCFLNHGLEHMCVDTVNVMESLFTGTVQCAYGGCAAPERLHQQTGLLRDALRGTEDSAIKIVSGERGNQFLNSMAVWLETLDKGRYDQTLETIQQYLACNNILQEQLVQLQRSLQWKMYQIITGKHLDAQRFFADEKLMDLLAVASRSNEDLLRWLEYMLRRLTEEDPDTKDATISRIQAYIREHISEDLDRERIASISFLSVDYISHLFTKKTGQCLSDYITAQRMELAKQLLATTNYSVSRIAMEAGYNNLSYFSRIFKRETGITPQKWRKTSRR